MWLQWSARMQHPDAPEAQAQALQTLFTQFPPEWAEPPVASVGLEPGHRIPLAQAHERLQLLVDTAKADTTNGSHAAGPISTAHWIAATELAEFVLCAMPNDAVALACLAEVEYAHGHSEFAVTYLRHATETMH